MLKKYEASFNSFDGTKIFYQFFEKPNACGTIIITHGQGEHSDAYFRLIEGLSSTNWNFCAWDLRGHGRSEGKRGYASQFDDYVKDFNHFNENILKQKFADTPLVYLSHSMGGTIFLKTALMFGVLPHKAVVLSAPLLGVSVPVPIVKDVGAQVLKNLWPTLTLGNEIKNEQLTRDPDVIREYESDLLRHHRISSTVYLGFLESFPWIQERAENFTSPLLLQISDSDPVVSTEKALEFYNKAGSTDKTQHIYSDSKHEIYNDINRQEVYKDLIDFLKKFEA